MSRRLTEKQKAALWQRRRSANFQASSRLEGIVTEQITLSEDSILMRLTELRRHYAR